MPKRSTRDNLLTYTVAITLAVLATGFAVTWLYLQRAEKLRTEVRYLTLPSVSISRDGHSIAATVAIRTSGADARQVADHQHALEQLAKRALMAVDPVRVRAPGGLQNLQQTLRESANTVLQAGSVQEVLITDFLVSEGDL